MTRTQRWREQHRGPCGRGHLKGAATPSLGQSQPCGEGPKGINTLTVLPSLLDLPLGLPIDRTHLEVSRAQAQAPFDVPSAPLDTAQGTRVE